MSDRARERGALYGGASGLSALLGVPKIGLATASLGIKALTLVGIAANPITAAVAGAVLVGVAVYGLTKIEDKQIGKSEK